MEYPKKLSGHLKNEVAMPRVAMDATSIPLGLFYTWGFPNTFARRTDLASAKGVFHSESG
jgi:hypothetical protein